MYCLPQISLILLMLLLSACGDNPWNNPYPQEDSEKNIYYDSFSERPKHLDPVASYSANEYVFLGQIYEPPLQYHFLKRPYELVPLTAEEIPGAQYFDEEGRELPDSASADEVASVRYRINIKPGIQYQPHPALAKDGSGQYLYHDLSESDLTDIHTLYDFTETGSRELIADDYVYQIKRMTHPKLHSPIAGLMSQYILGLDKLSAKLARQEQVDLQQETLEGVRVIDRYTYEITLKEKYPQFIYWLSMYFFSPMPWEADVFYQQAGMKERNISLDWYPIGTGAFMLAENNPNRRMLLLKNPNYRGELFPESGEEGDAGNGLLADAGKPMPFFDMAVYSLEKEDIPSWSKFLQGYYDTSGVVSDSFDQAVQFSASGDAELTEEMQARDIRLITAVTTSSFYIGFNMKDDVVGGDSERARLLRRAIAIAIDQEEFISIFANGRGIAAQGPIPPGIFGYLEGEQGIDPYVYDWVDGKPKRKSIEEAKALLQQAGYANGRIQETGEPLVLYYDSGSAGPGSKAQYDWLRKQFRKLNINLVIRATDYNRFQEKMLNGTSQIYRWGWNADYPDPENFLFLLYGPNAKVDTNGENASNYQNKEFDDLFEKMKTMSNGPERQELINRMVEILRHDSPWVWGFHPVGFSLHHSWYQNAKPNLMANNTLKYKRIDVEKRNAFREKWNKPVVWPAIVIILLVIASVIPAWKSYQKRQHAKATEHH